MIKQLFNIPRSTNFTLACSGGVDSMAVADFFVRGGRSFTLAYFDHGTGNSIGALPVVKKFADQNGVELKIGKITKEKPVDYSPEEHWRSERYDWLISLGRPIVTCHHLGDAVETWVFSSLHGNPKVIQSQGVVSSYGRNEIVMRPFLLNKKEELISWAERHSVSWFEDESNKDTRYPRNFIRHELINQCLKVNPGLFKVVAKKISAQRNA